MMSEARPNSEYTKLVRTVILIDWRARHVSQRSIRRVSTSFINDEHTSSTRSHLARSEEALLYILALLCHESKNFLSSEGSSL